MVDGFLSFVSDFDNQILYRNLRHLNSSCQNHLYTRFDYSSQNSSTTQTSATGKEYDGDI